MAKTEHENVTVQVPTNLLRLLEEKNYFGEPKDEWLINCVRQGVDGELNKLSDTREIRRLEKKYNIQPSLIKGGKREWKQA